MKTRTCQRKNNVRAKNAKGCLDRRGWYGYSRTILRLAGVIALVLGAFLRKSAHWTLQKCRQYAEAHIFRTANDGYRREDWGYFDSRRTNSENALNLRVRPQCLDDFFGQDLIKQKVKIAVQAAKQRSEPLDHLLFSGSPGLGKTTLAQIIAREMGVGIKQSAGPVIQCQADLLAILKSLERLDILFIDEIHRLSPAVEETLYAAMEDFQIDAMSDAGPTIRSIRIGLSPFTLIGATTRSGLLSSPLRARFGDLYRFELYSAHDLEQIIVRSARILGVSIDHCGALEIATRSRGTARVANRLLRRVRDYADVMRDSVITREVTDAALLMHHIDELGLDDMDRQIIATVIEKFEGGPVGLSSLAVALGEEQQTLEEVYEPYLIQIGFLKRTQQGRIATELAYRHLNRQLGASTTVSSEGTVGFPAQNKAAS